MKRKLVTEHLVLRKAREDDLDSIWKNVWINENLNKMMFWEATKTLEEAKDRLRRTIAFHQTSNNFFVCLKETDEAIGFAGVRPVDLDGGYEDSGIVVAEEYQGKGYGKEIVKALLDFAFQDLKAKTFYYSCFVENDISRKLCLSFGFNYLRRETQVRERDKKEVTLDFYYLKKEEYEAKRKMNIELEPLFEEYVDFDTFSKSDFRVVEIKECEAVPKSKKLLQFKLDDGSGEERIILSGIHAYYEPEDLVGKKVVAILNLPPRNMMGIDSCGMLMSAVHMEDGAEKLHLMIVDSSIPAGAKLY